MAIKGNLVVDQGASFETTINVTDDDDNPVDLTGYTGAAQLRKHYTSSSYTSFNVAITAVTGEVTLSLSANTTANIAAGRYVYDCEITNASVTTRIIEGIVTVTPQVTR